MVLKGFNIKLLKSSFAYLKLNVVTSKKVVFLDLVINLDQTTCLLNFSLYTKPTCTFSYLLNESNHPNFIFENIPVSLFIRIRRICSSFSDFLYFGSRLIGQLVNRGYNKIAALKTFDMVTNINRISLLPYKDKDVLNVNYDTIFFKFPFDVNTCLPSLESAFHTATNDMLSNTCFHQKKFKLIYKMQPNFSARFVHNFSRQSCLQKMFKQLL